MTIKLPTIRQDITNTIGQRIVFQVPEGVSSIAITTEMNTPTWHTYMVYDEKNELRAQFQSGNAPQPIIIHENREKTSPYTIYGEIGSGEWTIELGVAAKEDLAADAVLGTFAISFNEANSKADEVVWQNQAAEFQLERSEKIYQSEHKWYKGDFHTHTIYSDGKMTREENMQSAANQGLDFFVATDHNIVPTSWHKEEDILVIPGVEVTAPLGHFNVLAANTSPFSKNSLADMLTEEGMNRIIESDYGDAIISINHPFLTEWKWLFKETPLKSVDTIEICNDPTYPANEQATEMALEAWNILLNDGYKITGIGGSDSHLKPTDKYDGSDQPSLIGDPGTFVYCEGLSVTSMVQALRKGNVTVSRGERVDFRVGNLISGDTTDSNEGTAKASVETDTPLRFEWIVDGEIVQTDFGNEATFTFDFNDEDYHWLRVDVRHEDGRFYGFSNPIYFGEKQTSLKTWGELLEITKDRFDI